MTERSFNLVVPLPHEGNDMRIMDTSGSGREASSAVSPLNNVLRDRGHSIKSDLSKTYRRAS